MKEGLMMRIKHIHSGKIEKIRRLDWERSGGKYARVRDQWEILDEGDPVVLVSVMPGRSPKEQGIFDREHALKTIDGNEDKYKLIELSEAKIKPAVPINPENISISNKVSPPENLRATKVGSDSFTLEWDPPKDISKLRHGLSINERDSDLLLAGYENQGLVGFILESNVDELETKVLILRHDRIAPNVEKNIVDLGYTLRYDQFNESKHVILFEYFNGDNQDFIYCSNPIVDRLDSLGYNETKRFVIYKSKGEGLKPLYVYSTRPDIVLFEPLEPNDRTEYVKSEKIWSDAATDKDELGREALANGVIDSVLKLFEQKDYNDAYTILLNGEWGSGKSSMLNFFRNRLAKENYTIIQYNAWENQEFKDPWWILINAISQHASKKKLPGNYHSHRFWKLKLLHKNKFVAAFLVTVFLVSGFLFFQSDDGSSVKFYASLFGLIASFISVITGLVNNFFYKDLSKDQLKERFSEHPFDPIQKRFDDIAKENDLAIFIDDLDRCHVKTTVTLLEGIQNLFKKQRVLYIIAADSKWVSHCFNKQFEDFQPLGDATCSIGDKFLQKSFQLTVNVPKPDGQLRNAFFDRLIDHRDREVQVDKKSIKEEQQGLDEAKNEPDEEVLKEEKRDLQEKVEEATESFERNKETYLRQFAEFNIPDNPRQMKRFINQYVVMRQTMAIEGTLEKYDEDQAAIRYLILNMRFPTLIEKVKDGYFSVSDLLSGPTDKLDNIPEIIIQEIRELLQDEHGNLYVTDELIRGDFYSL